MTRPQTIPKDWQSHIDTYLHTMEETLTTALKKFQGPEHERLYDLHEAACFDFMTYLESHYGSARGFIDFLRADMQSTLKQLNLSPDHAGHDDDWRINGQGVVTIAENIGAKYKNNYCRIMEGLAHHRAYHHASPVPEPMPL